jgi:hypothetical protein
MNTIGEKRGIGRNWWWGGAALLAGTAIVLGARARKRPNIRCAYK